MRLNQIAVVVSLLFAAQVQAQLATGGALIVVQASGEVTHVNDEAIVTFSANETGRDKAAVASLVNKKMKQGTELLRSRDSTAKLQTENYNTIALSVSPQ